MLDAYAIRKAAPRIVLAVIGINLSIYLCLAAVDITNVVGRGIAELLTTPFVTADSYDITVDSSVENVAATGGIVGIFVGAGGLGAAAAGIAGIATAPLATLGALLIIMIPIALVALAVMATIVIRQALLIFLIIVSPVAIACFVLPGTEKYFRQWFDIFVKTLLVYPIIAIIFAMSDVFGAIIFGSAQAGNDWSGPVKVITGVIVIYAPLVLIPFAFRFAGGVIGQISKVAAGSASKLADLGPIKNRRAIAKRDLQNQQVQHRADIAGRLQEQASRQRRGGILGRTANAGLRGLATGVGGYNIEEQASAARQAMAKTLNDQIATGRDEEIRGLTVNKTTADQGAWEAAARSDGNTYGQNGLRRRTADGRVQYKSLAGAWIDDAHVRAGHARWGRDSFAQQAALSYEMRKAANNEEVADVSGRYMDLATGAGGWGMTQGMAAGSFKGAGFENQGAHLEFKHMGFDSATGAPQLDYAGFSKEAYEKKGTYALSQMSAHTFDQLREAHRNGDAETKARVEAVAESFMTRFGGSGAAIAGMEGDVPQMAAGNPLAARGAGGTSQAQYQTNAPGAAHVAEAVRQLAVDVGVYRPLDQSTETHSAQERTNETRQG